MLNQAMKQWYEGTLEATLRFPIEDLCALDNFIKIPMVVMQHLIFKIHATKYLIINFYVFLIDNIHF